MMEYLKSPEVTLTWQDLNVSLPDENAYSLTNLFNRSKSKLDEGQKQIINNGMIHFKIYYISHKLLKNEKKNNLL